MKTREEVARFIEWQFGVVDTIPPGVQSQTPFYVCPRQKAGAHHFGMQDVRVLLDFIYGGPPAATDQEVNGDPTNKATPLGQK